MQTHVQPRKSKRTALLVGVVVLSCFVTLGLGVRWVVSMVEMMRSPGAGVAKEFVVALAAGDRPRALQLCEPGELPEDKVLELERQSAELLKHPAWSVTYAYDISARGEEAVAAFVVPKLPGGKKARRAFIVDVVNRGGWKVRRVRDVDPEDYSIRISF
jgi:hypothetical protein